MEVQLQLIAAVCALSSSLRLFSIILLSSSREAYDVCVRFLCVDVTVYFYRISSSEKAMKRATTISRLVEVGLRFIGMWPDSAYPNLYWSLYMTMIAVSQYFQYSYIVMHFDMSNLMILADCLGLALANTLAFLKLFFLWWNRR